MARKQNDNARQVIALLTLAGRHGWHAVTPAKFAKAAGITAKAATAFLADPAQTMRTIADYVTAAAQQDYRHDPRNTPREALFEILMLRFDIVQRHHAGFLALHSAARRDPRLTAMIVQALYSQGDAILSSARIKVDLPQALLVRIGLAGITGATLCVWRRDDSPDLAKTMAALDRQLRRAEQLMRWVDRRAD